MYTVLLNLNCDKGYHEVCIALVDVLEEGGVGTWRVWYKL